MTKTPVTLRVHGYYHHQAIQTLYDHSITCHGGSNSDYTYLTVAAHQAEPARLLLAPYLAPTTTEMIAWPIQRTWRQLWRTISRKFKGA